MSKDLVITSGEIERFWSKVDKSGECWLWIAAGTKYGIFTLRNKAVGAHRVAYAIETGDWPEEVNHQCHTPKCVRPSHLKAGNAYENAWDRQEAGRGAPQHSAHNPSAKVNYETAESIRKEYGPVTPHGLGRRHGMPSMASLGQKYGLSVTQIHSIVHRLAYTRPE